MKRLSIFIYVLITVFTLATSVHAASKGNTTIQSFSKAKKILIKHAYSAPFRPLIPIDVGHPFRLIPATDSGASRPPIPEDSGHPV
jgi:hypothetical protein